MVTTASSLPGFLYSLYLFTSSDIKTVLIPTTMFGLFAAPKTAVHRVPHTLAWVWLNLLQFCVSNQSGSIDEDKANKPWRPLPAKRISKRSAVLLRWFLLPLCLGVSFCYRGATLPGLALAGSILLHNELCFDSNWITRNVCNALGYLAFNSGATYIACDTDCSIDRRTFLAQVMTSLVIMTTIHAQDFKDVEGDLIQGRRTLPIAFPKASRTVMALGLSFWSIAISMYWRNSILQSAGILALGVFLAARFLLLKSRSSDKMSYVLYNLWLCLVQIQPLIPGKPFAPHADHSPLRFL